MPATTTEAYTDDGWFITGDVGALGDDGRLTLAVGKIRPKNQRAVAKNPHRALVRTTGKRRLEELLYRHRSQNLLYAYCPNYFDIHFSIKRFKIINSCTAIGKADA